LGVLKNACPVWGGHKGGLPGKPTLGPLPSCGYCGPPFKISPVGYPGENFFKLPAGKIYFWAKKRGILVRLGMVYPKAPIASIGIGIGTHFVGCKVLN